MTELQKLLICYIFKNVDIPLKIGLLGVAGGGKSYCLEVIILLCKYHLGKNVLISATTGAAASKFKKG